MKTMGQRIKELLSQREMTQHKLADAAEITEPYLNYIINGQKKNPSFKVMCKIAKALSVSVSEFSDEEPIPPPTLTPEEEKLLQLCRKMMKIDPKEVHRLQA